MAINAANGGVRDDAGELSLNRDRSAIWRVRLSTLRIACAAIMRTITPSVL
jgi:hypothetical protein